jgi:hypothetical protein
MQLSPTLDAQLVVAFPHLYRDRHTDPYTSDSSMGWGFCCGDGWFDLLWELSSQLERLIAQLPDDQRDVTRAVQVKEKVGELRVYVRGRGTPAMFAAIERATEASRKICEICGAPRKQQIAGVWHVRCAAHR